MIINDNLQQSAGFTGQDETLFPSVSLNVQDAFRIPVNI